MRTILILARRTALAGLVVAGAAACRAPDVGATGRIDVVAGFYPLAEAARQVGGRHVNVANLTPPGVEPHDLELSPDQIERVVVAELVLYVGRGFQPAVEEAVGGSEGLAVDVLGSVPVLPGLGEGGGEGVDPHVWLDPQRMVRIVDRVERALADLDPSNRASFRESADAYRGRLMTLDGRMEDVLSRCRRSVIVTAHASFGYLADRFDLTQQAITGISPQAEPDPNRLAELEALVRDEDVSTIFTEELVSPDVAETLAAETGATTAVLNPLESLTPEQVEAGANYISVMRSNLAALSEALACG